MELLAALIEIQANIANIDDVVTLFPVCRIEIRNRTMRLRVQSPAG